MLTIEELAREHTERVKKAARDIGFDAVGIASAAPLDEEFAHYNTWLSRGYNGSLGYMDDRASRHDVRHILPSAKSVIVVARNYYTPHTHANARTHEIGIGASTRDGTLGDGKISRYAWGDDYHDVLPPMLDKLCEELKLIVPGSETRRYTDTGPVMEKAWAARAGVGWQGKHTNVLRRDIGSWFFLGLVITSIPMEYDEPMADHCGTCTACIQACPTHAIVEPYVMDASKCLSHWTIEVKPDVEIPNDIAVNMDGWLFGCDVCQDVCPWNRFSTPTDEVRFEPRHEQTFLPLQSIVNLQPDEFAERFRKSPVKRTKLAGLQRNARAMTTASAQSASDTAQRIGNENENSGLT